ncbi:MAG TPA: hypothetical protein VGK64_04735, partial [Bryobacteraceae bacterium]
MSEHTPAASRPTASRLVALDAFRGATMALMVLVNNAGDGNNAHRARQRSVGRGVAVPREAREQRQQDLEVERQRPDD